MFLYFLYLFFSPVLFIITVFLSFFNIKLRKNLLNFIKTLSIFLSVKFNSDKQILLFHAASSGEFEQLKPILKSINRDQYYIVQSFTSPTIFEQEQNNHIFDVACYHPFDFILFSYLFFKAIKPKKYIITRHDIWPGHIVLASIMKIECILINVNIHKNSIWVHPLIRPLSNYIFNKFHIILAPSNRIKNFISNQLNISSKIIVTGDSRFNQIIERSHKNKKLNLLPEKIKDYNNVLFGSIDSSDQKIIFQSLNNFDFKKRKIIIVPHETDSDTIFSIQKELTNLSLNFILFSELKNQDLYFYNVIIVDVVGILADLYQYANSAYVGGGFVRGVHSVIEPAIYNCQISFGPNYEILDEAKTMINENLAYQISDIESMRFFLHSNNDLNMESTKEFILRNEKNKTEILYHILN
ncbi:MAG: hypothetical protein CMG64_01330 [Candidatus Marinimicrobia bacterium]|nr:hypothetical protein [Candidatus Neomarinimicrobiota bacterium]|tara:strand:- start:26000 stop:27235 length:1236 start_codon:yes stop_codon:yes gene_type:complete